MPWKGEWDVCGESCCSHILRQLQCRSAQTVTALGDEHHAKCYEGGPHMILVYLRWVELQVRGVGLSESSAEELLP